MATSAASEVTYPQNLEAERALLGSILIDNAGLVTAMELLSKDDFYVEAHRLIFERMIQLSEKPSAIDLVTLAEEISREGLLDRTGGAAYIASLTDGVPFGAGTNVTEYCRIIRGKAIVRRLINVSNNVISRCL